MSGWWWWSYLLAAGGILGIWLAGRKDPRGWLLGLAMQVLWAAYAVATEQWGFILTAVGYGLVYGRNWLTWRAEDADPEPEPDAEHHCPYFGRDAGVIVVAR